MMQINQLVTIILVAYYSQKKLGILLSLIPDKYNIIITENSLDKNVKYQIEKNYRNVKVLIPKENLGNGGGINFALKNVNTKYALYLDIDVELDSNSIDSLIRIGEMKENWAILAPNIVNYKYHPDNFIKKNLEHNFSKMKFVQGCALFFNYKKLKKYGFFDTRIFLYYEEDDLFFKYHNKNLDIILCENIYIKHFGNSSSDKKYSHEIELNRNWHYMWSKFYYFKKNYSYFRGLKETFGHFIKSIIKIIFFYFTNKKKFLIYKNRASGLINSYLNKPSWRRPNIK